MRRNTGLVLSLTAMLCACTSLQQLGDVISFQPSPLSGYDEETTLSLFEIANPTTTKNAVQVSGQSPVAKMVPNGVQDGVRNACYPPQKGPGANVVPAIAATVLIAVGQMVYNEASYELGSWLKEKAKSFSSSDTMFSNLPSGPRFDENSCYLIVRTGKQPGASGPPVPLWYIGFKFSTLNSAGVTPKAVTAVPVYAEIIRSAARSKENSKLDIAFTLVLKSASKLQSGEFETRTISVSDFVISGASYGSSFPNSNAIHEVLKPATGPVFAAPPPNYFGILGLTVTEGGKGGKSFEKTADFLARHSDKVRDLLTALGNDSLLLKRITLDRAK